MSSASLKDGFNTGITLKTLPGSVTKASVAGFLGSILDYVDSEAVATSDCAYLEANGVDATAQLNNKSRPFRTPNAALAALGVGGGIIQAGIGDFVSPGNANQKSNVFWRGSGVPMVNSVVTIVSGAVVKSAPTKLTGGTVFKGPFGILYNLNNIRCENFGVDTGSEWCTNFNGGVASDCMAFVQNYVPGGGQSGVDGVHPLQQDSPPKRGIRVKDIVCLCKDATSPIHAFLMEDVFCPQVSNITTYFGMHGIVIKSLGGNFTDLQAWGHSANGVIIKANDYAMCGLLNVNNITISNIAGVGGGLILHSENSPLNYVNISNVMIDTVSFGIKTVGAMNNINIANINIIGVTGVGFDSPSGWSYSSLTNALIRGCGGKGVILKSTGGDFNFINGVRSLGNVGGFDVSAGTRLFICDIASINDSSFTIIYGTNVHIMGVATYGGAAAPTGTPVVR